MDEIGVRCSDVGHDVPEHDVIVSRICGGIWCVTHMEITQIFVKTKICVFLWYGHFESQKIAQLHTHTIC